MIRERHLCLGCLSDWVGSDEYMCRLCTYEHDKELVREGQPTGNRNTEPVSWYGPTVVDLDGVDSPSEVRNTGRGFNLPWGYSVVE